ncbi:unnamed protein product [Cuscuta campestris]|uniref:Uncharacterized protein n=1 Tax=Cuscuta campestris TaxID=132261 RepID=A0A484L3C6_9ASTE|nr:unnamed protein product [Cuscuta campestris]
MTLRDNESLQLLLFNTHLSEIKVDDIGQFEDTVKLDVFFFFFFFFQRGSKGSWDVKRPTGYGGWTA